MLNAYYMCGVFAGYVNLLVGLIALTSNVLPSGVIPPRCQRVFQFITLALNTTLYLYRNLDLGMTAMFFDMIIHLLRSVSSCTFTIISLLSNIKDVIILFTEWWLQRISNYLFQLLCVIHGLCILIYNNILLPLLNTIRYLIRAIWKNPFISLLASIMTMIVAFFYRDHSIIFIDRWKAVSSHIISQISRIIIIQSISWDPTGLLLPSSWIKDYLWKYFHSLQLDFVSIHFNATYSRFMEGTHTWITHQSFTVLCRKSSFGWVLFMLHLLISRCDVQCHQWASQAIMKAVYFPLITLNFLSIYLMDWFIYLLNKNAFIAMYCYIAINIILIIQVYRNTNNSANNNRQGPININTFPATSNHINNIANTTKYAVSTIQYLQSHTPHRRFDDKDCAICLLSIRRPINTIIHSEDNHTSEALKESVFLPCGM